MGDRCFGERDRDAKLVGKELVFAGTGADAGLASGLWFDEESNGDRAAADVRRRRSRGGAD